MFVDTAKIYVKAGDGGDGCSSVYKDKYTRRARRGIPNGGPGGRGGDVVIKVNENIHTLLDFQYRQHFKAAKGANGSSKNKKGKEGKDCIIEVPPGIIVKDLNSSRVIKDLAKPGDEVIVAKGGEGGRGNASKKPATKGLPGEESSLILELKLIANCGIVGFPNSGKSTLISKVSKARPKIASYPFTTREPVLGIVEDYKGERSFTVADIPGLIEGAHQGKGLGDKFLRHVERTKVLIHLIDMAAVDGRDPIRDCHSLNNELKQYGCHLEKKTQIIAANKMDLPTAQDNLTRFKEVVKEEVFPISAKTGMGIEKLMDAVSKRLAKLNEG